LIFSRTEAENLPPRRFDAKDEWATHSLDGAGSLLLLFLHHGHQVVPALPCQTAYTNPDLPQRASENGRTILCSFMLIEICFSYKQVV
jgi:hypothetical protein